jgi:xanthine dehydrogenase accessory factor
LNFVDPVVLIRGGGDLATGVAARLHRVGFDLILTEVAQPRVVRRLVAAAEAVYAGEIQVEDLHCRLVQDGEGVVEAFKAGVLPVLIDPDATIREDFQVIGLIDARMRKRPPEIGKDAAPLVIGLGPGFTAGLDCHAVIETNRGHHMGRVIWSGSAEPNTGIPEPVSGHDIDRVLRSPADGKLEDGLPLGTLVKAGDVIATVDELHILAPFDGALRGLVHDSLHVKAGEKVGDLDPRGDPSYCYQISDKSLAVGGGVLEALLSRPEIRQQLRG